VKSPVACGTSSPPEHGPKTIARGRAGRV